MKIKELKQGNYQIALLIKAIEQKETKKKAAYLILTLGDGKNEIKAKLWNMDKATFLKKGHSVGKILVSHIEVGTYNGLPDYTINDFRAACDDDHIQLNDFLALPPENPEKLFNDIVTMAAGFDNSTLSLVTVGLYNKNKDAILHASAAKSVHHNMLGGLLWHTYRMLLAGEKLCEVYTTADRELLLAGIMLHDIGKIKELETDEMGNASYTADGILFGHILIGIEMINDFSKDKSLLDKEYLRLLKAMIAQHHGEFPGSITQPNFLESMLLHELDMIDAKTYQFEKIHEENAPGSLTEQRYYTLGNVQVYTPEK